MNTEPLLIQAVVRQQAFRHVLDIGIVRHLIVVLLEEEAGAGYVVGDLSCPDGADGLPCFAHAAFTTLTRGAASLEVASAYYGRLVQLTGLRAMRIDEGETIALAVGAFPSDEEEAPPSTLFTISRSTPARLDERLRI